MPKIKKTNISKNRRNFNTRVLYEGDGIYFLKLVGVVISSTLWVKLSTPIILAGLPFGGFPLGACSALAAVCMFEKDIFDRKIWFAVVIVTAIISYFVPAGVVI